MTDFSFQLYCARNFPPLSGTLKMLAETGYRQVEGYGALYAGEPNLADELKANGLTMPTGHFNLDARRCGGEGARRLAEALGVKVLIVPAVPPEQRTQDESAWRAPCRQAAGAGRGLQRARLRFRLA